MSIVDDVNTYPMTNPRRGQFIIINNRDFDAMDPRLGTEVDAKNLQTVFNGLGFTTSVHTNVKAYGMFQLMLKAAAFEDASDQPCDCFGVAILTHGSDNGVLYGTDGPIEIDNFVQPIKECQSLVGKPKFLIVQACRGEKLDSGMKADGGTAAPTQTPPPQLIPMEADFLYAYSTPPGHYAWRNQTEGSWFIQTICDLLPKHQYEMDLVRILTRVNRRVAVGYKSCAGKAWLSGKKQVPSIVSMLTRELQFTPK